MNDIVQSESVARARLWRAALLALCLCCGGLRLWSMAYLERSVVPAEAGGMGARLRGPYDGPLWMLKVLSVAPGSDLARQGVKAGDRLSFDRVGDPWRVKGVDELIPVTIESQGALRQLSVRTSPQPERVRTIEVVRQLSGLVESFLALGIAAVLSWRRADSHAMRALALALAIYSIADVGSYLPGGTVQGLLFLSASSVQFFVTSAAYLYFAIAYPDTQSRFSLPWVRRAFALLVALGLSAAAFEFAFHLRLTPLYGG